MLALALDEAHKFMRGDGDGDGLSHARWSARRVRAHWRPSCSSVSVCAMHRFHSRDWCKYLAQKLVESAVPLSAVFKMRVRQRLTADRGLTRTQRRMAGVGAEEASGRRRCGQGVIIISFASAVIGADD